MILPDLSNISTNDLMKIVFKLCTSTVNSGGCFNIRCVDCPLNSTGNFKEHFKND